MPIAAEVASPSATNLTGNDEMKQCNSDLPNLAVHIGFIRGEL